MLKRLIFGAILGEGIVGITLTVFVLRGNQSTHSISTALALLGAMVLLVGVFPTGNAGRVSAGAPMIRTMDIEIAARKPRVFGSEGIGRVLSTFITAAIVFATAMLFYVIPAGS
jgi:hypothetical protein